MHKYVLKRLLMLIPVIIGVTFVVFFILNLELGLNDPIFVRYFHYMRDLLHGSLGVSYKNSIPVWVQVVERLPNTAILACAGILVALLIGIPIGIISAKKQYSLLDHVSMELESGHIYCLTAPSGKGKTTLFRILMGLETADSGRLFMERVPIGAVFQEDRLC